MSIIVVQATLLCEKLCFILATIPRFPRETMHFLSCATFIGNRSNRLPENTNTSVGYLNSAE